MENNRALASKHPDNVFFYDHFLTRSGYSEADLERMDLDQKYESYVSTCYMFGNDFDVRRTIKEIEDNKR